MVSSITSTLTLLLIALSFFLEWSAVPTLIVLCAFMFCFSIGLGPLTFVVAAEVSFGGPALAACDGPLERTGFHLSLSRARGRDRETSAIMCCCCCCCCCMKIGGKLEG